MKKIIIVNNNLQVGGVQKSLCNLLWSIHDRCDVTLCLFRAQGPYLQQLPANVKIIECGGLARFLGMSQGQCHGMDKLLRGALAAAAKIFGRDTAMKLVLAGEDELPDTYDCAIAFLQNGNIKNFYGGVQEYVLQKISAKQKIAFLHCDYATCGANHPANNRLIAEFDRIAACSEGCREAFLQVLPELAERCVTVKNCHNFNEIRDLSRQTPAAFNADCRNVVMVSRLAHEKGIERAIEAVAYVLRHGVQAQLHIVGGGPMEGFLWEEAARQGMEDCVHFYGQQSNPYPYMRSADLFLMTSFHEAAPMVIEEARCLGVPTLTVRTTSSHEMVTLTSSGWVCENDQQALNEKLLSVLSDADGLREVRQDIQSAAMDNSLAEAQFMHLIEG